MKTHSHPLVLCPGVLASLACLPVAGEASAEHRLTMSASTPEVVIETRAAGRNFINLPSLEFNFVLGTACDEGMSPGALMLSVADTTLILNDAQIKDERRTELTLRIPAEQMGPVPLNRFCAVVPADSPVVDPAREARDGADTEIDDEADNPPHERPARRAATPPSARSPDTLLLQSVLSAQGSLMCRNEQTQKVVYASHSLDVVLSCNWQQESESVPAGH